jgi:Ni,Fe-hydrogenase III small subunit
MTRTTIFLGVVFTLSPNTPLSVSTVGGSGERRETLWYNCSVEFTPKSKIVAAVAAVAIGSSVVHDAAVVPDEHVELNIPDEVETPSTALTFTATSAVVYTVKRYLDF